MVSFLFFPFLSPWKILFQNMWKAKYELPLKKWGKRQGTTLLIYWPGSQNRLFKDQNIVWQCVKIFGVVFKKYFHKDGVLISLMAIMGVQFWIRNAKYAGQFCDSSSSSIIPYKTCLCFFNERKWGRVELVVCLKALEYYNPRKLEHSRIKHSIRCCHKI